MAYEQRDNSGTLFKNEKKTSEKHPNMTGSAMIDGVEYWISAWTKEGKKGRFQSLAFTRKEERQQGQVEQDYYNSTNDDIPF